MDDLPANPEGITTKQDAWDSKERQTIQILIETGGINEDEMILNPLYEEMNRWQYPLHFLDFEALRLAIPFLKGRRPYEQLKCLFLFLTRFIWYSPTQPDDFRPNMQLKSEYLTYPQENLKIIPLFYS